MAKLNEEVVIIKVSELLKDNEEPKSILDNEMITNFEAVIDYLIEMPALDNSTNFSKMEEMENLLYLK